MDKCDKYREFFVFQSDENFKNHTESCPDCKETKEKFDKVSRLLSEARPLYFKEKRAKTKAFAICAAFFLVFGMASFHMVSDSPLGDRIKYGQTLSAEDYGFPVDEYGLIMVDE